MNIGIDDLTPEQMQVIKDALESYRNKSLSVENRTWIEDEKADIAYDLLCDIEHIKIVNINLDKN